MKKPLRLSPWLRRSSAVLAVASVLVAGVTVIDRDRSGGVGLSALPGATGQPAPTGPTGGSGGGSGGAPPFPMQPPDMPSGPPNGYNSGSYPAPDQGNGISIYNSGAPESPGSQGDYQQGSNNPQRLQPANGSQPPNYDAPLQTAAQPSVAPTQAPHSAAPQQPQPSQAQQQPQNNQDQNGQQQKQQQCQSAFGANGNVATFVGGGGRSPVFFNPALDPTAPTPPAPCPNCKPDMMQKQLNDMQQQMNRMQQRMDQMEQQHQLDQQQRALDEQKLKQDDQKIQELQDQVKEQQKCSAGDWISAAWGAIGGLLTLVGARKAGDSTDFISGLGGGIAMSGAAVKVIECISK